MRFDTIAIVGVGMIGGSLGLALRAQGLAQHVVGVDRNAETLEEAVAVGAIEHGSTDLAESVATADGIVLAAPVGVIPDLLEALAPHVRPDALITDLGSTKARIVETGERLFGARFVGSHPMAGSASSGIGAALVDLYADAAWAVVRSQPFDLATDPYASRLAELITALGARPIPLDAARHDHLVALVSHLPHLLSFAFAQTVAVDESAAQARALAGGSYRDLIRVSAADPFLWRDIFLENRTALLDALTAYESHLQALKSTVEAGDTEALLHVLAAIQPSSSHPSG